MSKKSIGGTYGCARATAYAFFRLGQELNEEPVVRNVAERRPETLFPYHHRNPDRKLVKQPADTASRILEQCRQDLERTSFGAHVSRSFGCSTEAVENMMTMKSVLDYAVDARRGTGTNCRNAKSKSHSRGKDKESRNLRLLRMEVRQSKYSEELTEDLEYA